MNRIGMMTVAAALIVALAGVTPASALDVSSVSVRYATVRLDEAVAGYVVQFIVQGSGLTGVDVKNLTTNQVIPLAGTSSFRSFDNSFTALSTFNALHADPEAYLFTFNGGADAIILGFSVNAPNFVNILHPAHLSAGVELDPIYSWDSVASLGGYMLGMSVSRLDNGATVFQNAPEFNTALTTWQPGALDPGTSYNFHISIFNIMGGQPISTQTLFGDAFTYSGFYQDANQHTFRTGVGGNDNIIPEPASLALFGSATLFLVGMRRRRRMG